MEWKFKRDTAFRKQFFVPESFAHPAKMDAQLLIKIVEEYTQVGETILDPMAGSGTTMLACGLGRNVVLVELEEKFCKMMRDNWEEVRMRPQLGYSMGTCQIIQGDARQLTSLCDKIITSPPYADQPQPSRTNHGILNHKPDCMCNFCRKNRGNKGAIQGYRQLEGLVDKIVTSPPYANPAKSGDSTPEAWEYMDKKYSIRKDQINKAGSLEGYGQSEGQIGNLPYGEIDKCIFSPPYAETGVGDWQTGRAEFQAWVLNELATKGCIEWQGKRYTESEWRAMNHGRIDGRTTKGVHKHPTDGYGEASGQVGNLPYGQIDKIVTSPPYEEAMGKKHHSPRADKLAQEKSNPVTYTDRVDSIITSPPYEGSISETEGRRQSVDETKYTDGRKTSGIHSQVLQVGQYSGSQDNIGNLKSQSYLEAMLQVYRSCFAVLKDGGLMILVTKNFIRNKQVARLDEDTIKLCEQASFSFLERHNRELPAQSFWRVIYHKKHPEVEQILFEDILVFKKDRDAIT